MTSAIEDRLRRALDRQHARDCADAVKVATLLAAGYGPHALSPVIGGASAHRGMKTLKTLSRKEMAEIVPIPETYGTGGGRRIMHQSLEQQEEWVTMDWDNA